ncbi:MAG TPA: HNH endonuclease signature motif containing protein, partial [Streptosporangiaceae bacterium]|nr:HNH endonuclease signature motif containing protein [Streptosporangiaceae bacterium]
RDRTCRFGPCGQPAWRTDIDHTIPWHKGGPTCPCNLGGCCRTHHQIKALPGWHLHQPQPGTFTWTTPASRTYHTQPDPYPV